MPCEFRIVSASHVRACKFRRMKFDVFLAIVLLTLIFAGHRVSAADDDFYAAPDDDANGNYNYNKNYNAQYNNNNNYYNANNDDAAANGNNDDANNKNDDANNQNDDANANGGNNAGDDGAVDDAYNAEKEQFQDADDDSFTWKNNVGFDGVSVMPLSCINYNSGHMIKFQLFDSAQSYQCHFAEIATFVVSIAHYMRAYFNYQALVNGQDFQLPHDAAYLNCIQMSVNGVDLYAKIGCMERETFTSTKLQLHFFLDQQCSQPYDDGQTARQHASKGYIVGGSVVSTKVSFRPEFYTCLECKPNQISATFNKLNSNWYDDDYINKYGNKQQSNYNQEDNNNNAANQNNDDQAVDDLYYKKSDDSYNNNAVYNYNNQYAYNNNGGDDYYGNGNGGNRRRMVGSPIPATIVAAPAAIQAYHDSFWAENNEIQRQLYGNNYYDVGNWNMCHKLYQYGVWCDEECRSLDLFRTDMWSASDIFLLSIMCTFMTAMMLLIIAKRLKAQQKARMYGEDQSIPGLPPCAMLIIFGVVMGVIVTLAKLKFINETLVFAVVTCILLFIYMLKLTLFESRRPVLLAAPRHDMFDNPLDDHLFE